METSVANNRKAPGGNGMAVAAAEVATGNESLPAERCLEIYRIMVRSRAMEERMIKMSKSGEGYFWIGGPGEEAFNAALGLQVHKGLGPAYDFLHLHYRNSATLVAMGMPLVDGIRQMAMTLTDPHSMGRNFVGHYAYRPWNVVPISSVIENQYVIAPGTALVQKRLGGDGITIVTGGDAGTAEGDFASCLVWSTRPGIEVPIFIIVMNNGWGISTTAASQHGEQHIVDRGKAFGIPGDIVDGNDPIPSWHAIRRGMEYCRHQRRPYMLEARVSRLHGHSSSSGAIRVKIEPDCIALFEQKLLSAGVLEQEMIEQTHEAAAAEAEVALEQALGEPRPAPPDIYKHTYAPSGVDEVYPGDYTGLPGRDQEPGFRGQGLDPRDTFDSTQAPSSSIPGTRPLTPDP
jgi:2-oxoisovalerate dehydrogenase E1 component alpha subunit